MKKLFIALFSLMLVTGCSTQSSPQKEVSQKIKSQVTYINVGHGGCR